MKLASEWEMKTMKAIKRTSDLVKEILEQVPDTRNSDMLLYYMVCYKKNITTLGQPFGYVIMNLKSLKLPPFESVRRSRQKIQSIYPELAGSDEVEAQRMVNEQIVFDYARKVNV